MGLLKLGSIYKKKSKKSPEVPAPPLPTKLEPISLELNLNLNQSSLIDTTNDKSNIAHKNNNDDSNATPAGSGSLFEDIFAELGSKTVTPPKEGGKEQPSVFDNDFSLALALSQQLDLEQDSTNPMTGTAKSGNNMSYNNNNNSNKVNNASDASTSNAPTNFLFGGDSIYSNYLKGLSALDNNSNTTSSLSTSMFDSILNKNSNTTATASPPMQEQTAAASTDTPSSYITQVVLDSDISDSDEESKNSEDSDEEYDLLNSNGKTQRRTRGVKPIMERRTQDNRLLVQRKIDNWSNRVDPESNRVESNESMIERMKDRHRNQVKMAALRNQQQQLDDYNMMGYLQQPQHMVPQTYGAPNMMPLSSTNGAVLQHPGMLMDPVQMYYPNTYIQPVNNDHPDLSMNSPQTHNNSQTAPIPAAFLPNPTHHSLSVPYPSENEEKCIQRHEQHNGLNQQYSSISPDSSASNSNIVMMNYSNNNSRTNSSTINNSRAKLSATPSSVSSTTSSKNPSSLAVNLEQDEIDENILTEEKAKSSTMIDNSPQDNMEMAAEEADCEISGDEEINASRTASISKKKKSTKKLRQQSKNDVFVTDNNASVPRAIDSGYTNTPQVVRSSRSTPNLKKGKKKSNPSSRNSSRRNSQDFTNSPSSELMVATPPPLPNSPYLNYNDNSEENLCFAHRQTAIPRSSSQHQLHYQHQQHYQNQEHRQSLRHMKSEPELPRRSNSTHSPSNVAYQQQKLYQQQQQLNLEWERMQSFQREQLLKQNVQKSSQQSVPFMPMYTPVYYPAVGNTPAIINSPTMMVGGMMVDPSLYSHQHQQQHQNYDVYQGQAYPGNASVPYNNNYQHKTTSYHNSYNSSTR